MNHDKPGICGPSMVLGLGAGVFSHAAVSTLVAGYRIDEQGTALTSAESWLYGGGFVGGLLLIALGAVGFSRRP